MFGNPPLHQRLCWPSESERGQVLSTLRNPPAHSIRIRQLTTRILQDPNSACSTTGAPDCHSVATEWTNVVLMTFTVAWLILVWTAVEETQLMWRERSCCSTMTHRLRSQHKVQVCFAFLAWGLGTKLERKRKRLVVPSWVKREQGTEPTGSLSTHAGLWWPTSLSLGAKAPDLRCPTSPSPVIRDPFPWGGSTPFWEWLSSVHGA